MAGESQELPSTGVPDPTVLTTEQMLLAIKNLEKLVESWREADNQIAIVKFDAIQTQLRLIETQRVEQKKDTKDAVDAALAAAKEAVKEQTTASQLATDKTEKKFESSLAQQDDKFSLSLAGVTTSLGDLKERVAEMIAARRTALAIGAGAVGVMSLIVAVLSYAR